MKALRAWLIAVPAGAFFLLPMLQLLVALLTLNATIGALLCTSSHDRVAGAIAGGIWLLLAASLPIGIVAIGVRQLRLAYLILLALIPVALTLQHVLLAQKFLYCDPF